MKRSDLTIVAGVGLLALVAAFWFLVLSPKREEASELQAKVDELTSLVSEQEQLATTAEAAESDYTANYRRLVTLGKAVPADADTSSLLVEIQGIADGAKVSFDSIELADNSDASAAAVATPPPLTSPSDPSGEAPETGETTPPAERSSETPPAETTPTAATTAAPATEAAAATLPLGASVGAAGLPVMPYTMTFAGGFFEIADFMSGVDRLVTTASKGTGVRGRLITVDGFSLEPAEAGLGSDDPPLIASLAATTYLTPAEQGLTAGAAPAAPPASIPPATPTPASSTTTAAPAATP